MVYCKQCGARLPGGADYCPKCGTPVNAAPRLAAADWGERFVAWLIDIVILGAAIGLLRLFVWVGWPGWAWAPGIPAWLPFVDLGLSNVVYFLYWFSTEGAWGQSFGKMVMRLQVVGLDGGKASMAQAAIESVGKAFLLPLDCILGWVFYPNRGQRIFNFISKTTVIKTPRR